MNKLNWKISLNPLSLACQKHLKFKRTSVNYFRKDAVVNNNNL